jgi:hypothetical protein
VPKANVTAAIQEIIEPKKLDPATRFQLVENVTTINEEEEPHKRRRIVRLLNLANKRRRRLAARIKRLFRITKETSSETPEEPPNTTNKEVKPLTIERILPLDNRELLACLEKTKMSDTIVWHQLSKSHSNAASKQNYRVTGGNICLYRRLESADDSQVNHFIYCIMPKEISENMMVCVLSLLQRKIINRKDTEPRYEYSSSLIYMKLPSREREEAFDSHNNNRNVNDEVIPLNMGVKKEIIQLVKDRNQCFRNVYNNVFYESQLIDWPITLPDDYKAHVAAHQSVAPPYLLSITLRDEFDALVSNITCICVTLYANSIFCIRKKYIKICQVRSDIS